jgi:5-methylcytosine-specific restriction endonuclease McrA
VWSGESISPRRAVALHAGRGEADFAAFVGTFRRMQQVLVLNASYEPLNVCSVRRAYVLVFKGKAELIEALDRPLATATDTYPWPHVIRLVNYVRVPRAVQRKISRRALFARDGWRCVYCGTSTSRLTLDHVVPRSRGGESVWENVVTSCAPCNLRKGDKLLEHTPMVLTRLPRPPAPVLFIRLAAPKIPSGWEPYLARWGELTSHAA